MEIIAYCAGVLTIIGFLPQTIKTIRTRETKDLALASFLIIGTSALLWTIYGIGVSKPALWITNGIVLVCSLIITGIKLHNRDS